MISAANQLLHRASIDFPDFRDTYLLFEGKGNCWHMNVRDQGYPPKPRLNRLQVIDIGMSIMGTSTDGSATSGPLTDTV